MGFARVAFDAAKHPRGFHGRFGHGTGSAGADRVRARLKLAQARRALPQKAPSRLETSVYQTKTERTASDVIEGAGHRVAANWKVSDADLEALIREEKRWDAFKDYTPEERKQHYVAGLIRQWNGSSGGVVQNAAISHVLDKLGISYQSGDIEARTRKYITDRPALHRAATTLGDAMYKTTQDWFKARGITEVKAFRGSRGVEWDKNRPFTSWALHRGGLRLPEGEDRTIREENIPVGRIFSIPPTGFGNLDESELVVMPLAPSRQRRSVANRAARRPAPSRTARSLMLKG